MRPPVIRKVGSGSDPGLARVMREAAMGGDIARASGVEIGPDRLLELGTQFGNVFEPVALPADKELGSVTLIREAGHITSATNWHHDQSFSARPPDWSLLYCVEPGGCSVPTAFCDGAGLLSYLSSGLVEVLASLEADHLAYYPEAGQGPDEAVARATHPVIVAVEGGVRALFAAPMTVTAFRGWSDFDSRPLLDRLYQMMNWPEMTVSHVWQKGDLLLWPNRRYPHRALALDVGRLPRCLIRIVGHWR
jgi:alpha-ketoglutarate-dependent sulfate ester dioxygenase